MAVEVFAILDMVEIHYIILNFFFKYDVDPIPKQWHIILFCGNQIHWKTLWKPSKFALNNNPLLLSNTSFSWVYKNEMHM